MNVAATLRRKSIQALFRTQVRFMTRAALTLTGDPLARYSEGEPHRGITGTTDRCGVSVADDVERHARHASEVVAPGTQRASEVDAFAAVPAPFSGRHRTTTREALRHVALDNLHVPPVSQMCRHVAEAPQKDPWGL
jgi:hypothetical protein